MQQYCTSCAHEDAQICKSMQAWAGGLAEALGLGLEDHIASGAYYQSSGPDLMAYPETLVVKQGEAVVSAAELEGGQFPVALFVQYAVSLPPQCC